MKVAASCMAGDQDCFSLLGLGVTASRREVESAFRQLALKCHPDRHPTDSSAKARFERLSRAKEELLNPVSREAAELRRRARSQISRPAGKATKRHPAHVTRQRRAAAEKRQKDAEKLRKDAEERLRRREAKAKKVAEEQRRRKQEAAEEAARRREEFCAQEDARQRAAEHERARAAIFEAWCERKRSRKVPQHSNVAQASSARSPTLGTKITEVNQSDSDSPWEPPEGTLIEKKKKRHADKGANSKRHDTEAKAQRHDSALERLKRRRLDGEGLRHTTLGSWFVVDEEAERYARYVDQCGF